MGFDRTLVLTLAVELAGLAFLVWAVTRQVDRRQLDRRVAAIVADLDGELACLFGAPDSEEQP